MTGEEPTILFRALAVVKEASNPGAPKRVLASRIGGWVDGHRVPLVFGTRVSHVQYALTSFVHPNIFRFSALELVNPPRTRAGPAILV